MATNSIRSDALEPTASDLKNASSGLGSRGSSRSTACRSSRCF